MTVGGDVTAVDRWIPPDLQHLIDAHPGQREAVEEGYWAGVRAARPFVGVDPAMRSGQPTINHTRLTVDAVAGMVWAGEPVNAVADDYGITRADVLVACWFAGRIGLPGVRSPGLAATRWWRDRWGAWAAGVHEELWASRTGSGYEAIPDPPDETEWDAR